VTRPGLTSANGLLLPGDHREVFLERPEALLQGAKHRGGALGVMSGLSQLVHDLLLPGDTGLKLRDVPLGLSKVLVVHASRVAQARDERLAKRIVSKRSLYCRDARTIRLSDIFPTPLARERSGARKNCRCSSAELTGL
jgi:hypothetical protein